MTDSPEEDEGTPFDEEAATAAHSPLVDPQLQMFLGIVEDLAVVENGEVREGYEPGLTLHVAGTIVTGRVAPYIRWADAFSNLFEGRARDGVRSGLGLDDLDELAAIGRGHAYYERYNVHLLDAKTYVDGKFIPTNSSPPWRGRLAAVSGWSLGMLEPT